MQTQVYPEEFLCTHSGRNWAEAVKAGGGATTEPGIASGLSSAAPGPLSSPGSKQGAPKLPSPSDPSVSSNFSLKQLTSFKSSLKELVHPN